MIKVAIEKIEQLAKPEIITISGREYSTKSLHPMQEPEPTTLQLHTLTGVSDYLHTNMDGLDTDKTLVIVKAHDCVRVLSSLMPPFKNRGMFLECTQFENSFRFGAYYPVEDFIIQLQANFESNPHRNEILAIVGNLKEEHINTTADNGITQTVTAKLGIAMAKEVPLPNPVILKPYRTFLEVNQPESPFILRMRKGPECALFEADGGMWKLEAINRISEWLNAHLPENMTVIA